MTTTQKNSPKSQGFQGVRDAIWIIVICAVIAFCFYEFFLGGPSNFRGGDNSGEPANLLGTIYKGGIVVPVIFTLLFTVIALGVERYLALRNAFGKCLWLNLQHRSKLPLKVVISLLHTSFATR